MYIDGLFIIFQLILNIGFMVLFVLQEKQINLLKEMIDTVRKLNGITYDYLKEHIKEENKIKI